MKTNKIKALLKKVEEFEKAEFPLSEVERTTNALIDTKLNENKEVILESLIEPYRKEIDRKIEKVKVELDRTGLIQSVIRKTENINDSFIEQVKQNKGKIGEIEHTIQNIQGVIPKITTRIEELSVGIKQEIEDSKKPFITRDVFDTTSKTLKDSFEEAIKNTGKSLNNSVGDIVKEIDRTKDLIKETEGKLNKSIEIVTRKVGGGNANRNIAVNGNSSTLSRYGDINLKAGSNVTLSYANNNTSKMLDLTIAASGGGGGSVSSVIAGTGINVNNANPATPIVSRASIVGDITVPENSNTATLTSILTSGGPTGSSSVIPIITWDAKGRLVAVSSVASAGGGNVSKVGTPANDQIGVWTGDGTIEGTSDLTFSGSTKLGVVTSSGTLFTIDSTNTGGVGGSGFYQMATFYAGNMASGNTAQYIVGRNASLNNAYSIDYVYSADGSTSNKIGFGFYATNNVMTLDVAGNLILNGVSGTVEINSASSTPFNMTTTSTGIAGQYNQLAFWMAPNQSSGGYAQFFIGKQAGTNDCADISFIYSGASSTSNYLALGFYANGELIKLFGSGTVVINDGGVSTADLRVEGDTDPDLLFTDASADKVGIGTSAPGTKLDVNGVISANTGTVSKKATHGGKIKEFFTDVGNGTTVETDLYTYITEASVLNTNGDAITAEMAGTILGAATPTRQIKAYFGGTMIYDSSAATFATNTDWNIKICIVRVSSTVVRCTTTMNTTTASSFVYTKYTEVTALTLSNTNIFKITGQAAGAGAATNDIIAKLGVVSWLPTSI